jgi:GT2 family glycosyltransferase
MCASAAADPTHAVAAARGLVSVVIAAYNADRFIGETCRSALAQSYAPLEVVVVDDGSTDATAAVVEAIAATEPRLRLIRQPNRGVAAARNAAVAGSAGEFIAPLDADDIWDPTKVARQVARLEEAGPTSGMAYCGWAWMDEDGRVLDRSPHWTVEGDVLHQLVEVNFTGSASVPLFRRRCLEAVGGYDGTLRDRGRQGCEDWDLALRVAERWQVVVVPAVLVGYRRRRDSMSAACATMWRSREAVMQALATRHPSVPPDVLARSRDQFALHLAGVAFWSGQFVEACRWALRARSVPLLATVAPHVARLLTRGLLGQAQPGTRIVAGEAGLDASSLPRPLIPYDRIYERRWRDRGSD